MGFFKKRAAKGPRRSFKLWRQKFKKSGIVAAAAILLGAAGALLWTNAPFGAEVARAKGALNAELLSATAKAGFRVEDILVTGRRHVTQKDLQERIGAAAHAPLFGVNIAELQKSIEQIPWVKSAAVARRLPGTITIDIQERAPLALWQYRQKVSVIDAEGAVLTAENLDSYGGLPLVVGENAEKNAAALLALLNAEPLIARHTASAVRVGNRRWDLHLENGIVVKLPEKNPELALTRLARAEASHAVFEKNVAALDLRLEGRIVVEPKAENNENI